MDNTINVPKLSAVMIVYNGDRFISDAIESVLKQTFREFELVVLNDGSTDETENIILNYKSKDQRIVYIKNETKKGLSYSRNRVVSEAKAPIIAVTDSDDVSDENRFKIQYEFLTSHSDISIVGSALTLIDQKSTTFDQWVYPEYNTDITKGIKNSCVVANPACMFHKNVFLSTGGYDTDLTICEDWDFFVQASNHNFKFHNLNIPLINYRIHNNNISKNKLEHTVVYSLYCSGQLTKEEAGNDIKTVLINHPELKTELVRKITQFYVFWMGVYFKAGYTSLYNELFQFVKNNYFKFFPMIEKLRFINSYIKLKLVRL